MPVTVQIPDTSAFLETTLADFDVPEGVFSTGGFLYGIGKGVGSVGKFFKMDKTTFASPAFLTFADDGKHFAPVDFCYVPAPTNRFYVLFRNGDTGQLTVGKINPDTPAIEADFKNVDLTGDFHFGPGSLTTDNTYLYIASFHDDPSQILKYRLSDAVFILNGPATGATQVHCIRHADGKIFVSGLAPSLEEAIVLRMNASTLEVEQSKIFSWATGEFAIDKFGVSANHIWVGNRNTSGIVKRFLKTNLDDVADIATSQASKCGAVDWDGANIWALFENGRAARINPNDSTVALYTVNEGQGFQREITGDGTYIFTAT